MLQPNTQLIITTDDFCPSNIKYFKYWERVRECHPDMSLTVFTIANYQHKENVRESSEFNEWFEKNKDWCEVAVHGYDHLYPPEVFRDDLEECINKSLDILLPYLPKKYGYRSPGFRFTNKLEPILKKLGFAWVAYQNNIKYFNDNVLSGPLLNTHCCEKWDNPITEVWEKLCYQK